MHELTEIYELLRGYNLCANQSQFSRDWLGRSDGYYAYLMSSEADPNPASLGMLSARISNVLVLSAGKLDEGDRKRLLKAAVTAGLLMFRDKFRELRHVRSRD